MTLLPDLEQELAGAAKRLAGPRPRLSATWRVGLGVATLGLLALAFGVTALTSREDRARDRSAQDDPAASGPTPNSDPPQRPSMRPRPGTLSPPARVTIDGVTYRAFGYLSAKRLVCIRVLEPGVEAKRSSTGCLNDRGARSILSRQPAHLFSTGGTRRSGLVSLGLARAEVTAVRAATGPPVILSRPWRPTRNPDPIRFFAVFTSQTQAPKPGQPLGLRLQVRINNGPLTNLSCHTSSIRPTVPPECPD